MDIDQTMGRIVSLLEETTKIAKRGKEKEFIALSDEMLSLARPLSGSAGLQAAILHHRGIAKHRTGDDAGAIADYDQALEIAPHVEGAEDIYNDRGVMKFDAGDLAGAMADYNQALEINSKFLWAYNNRGLAKSKAGDHAGAIADYDQALEIEPRYAGAYMSRGNAKYKLEDYAGAIADYDQALDVYPSWTGNWLHWWKMDHHDRKVKNDLWQASTLINRAIVKDTIGDYEGVIADCDSALELDPKDAGAYNTRGGAKRNIGDIVGAIADYDRALEIDPDDQIYVNNRIRAGLVLRHMEQAPETTVPQSAEQAPETTAPQSAEQAPETTAPQSVEQAPETTALQSVEQEKPEEKESESRSFKKGLSFRFTSESPGKKISVELEKFQEQNASKKKSGGGDNKPSWFWDTTLGRVATLITIGAALIWAFF